MKPKRLRRGGTIALIAPSDPISEKGRPFLEKGMALLEKEGFRVFLGKNALKRDRWGFSGGTPEERAEDFNRYFKDDKVDAIWCVHGGETVNQILPLIDFNAVKKNPKIFLGMSDIDVLHLAIQRKTGLVTFHGASPKAGAGVDLEDPYTWDCFVSRMLEGEREIKPSAKRKCLRPGKGEGKIVGCNLSSITKLLGSPDSPDFKNAVLFIESFVSKPKDVLWKLTQVKQAGLFDRLKGVVIGYIYGFQDPAYTKERPVPCSYEELVMEVLTGFKGPVMKVEDFGHGAKNCFLPMGGRVFMDSEKGVIRIQEDFFSKG